MLNNPSYFDDKRFSARILPRIHPSVIRRLVVPRRFNRHAQQLDADVELLGKPSFTERLLIKDVTVCLCAGVIADWLGADVFVLRRDPKKVVASWQKIGFPPEPIHQQSWVANEVISPLGIDVPDWSMASHAEKLGWTVGLLDLALMTEAANRRWPVVTHEQLIANPVQEFQELTGILGLEPTDALWQFLKDSEKSEGSRFSTSRTAQQLRDSSNGVFCETDKSDLDNVLGLLAQYLPKIKRNG